MMLCAAAMVCVIAAAGLILQKEVQEAYSEAKIQRELAENVIRFHIRANSDTDEDQARKMTVKESVTVYIASLLEDSESIDDTRKILSENIDGIRDNAEAALADAGCDDSVAVYFENSYFSERVYGDVTFPQGTYETFRIDIGEAYGHNWWCVLYPPLSFVDASAGTLSYESKQELKNILTEDEYNAITEKQTYKFKYLKFLNFLFEK